MPTMVNLLSNRVIGIKSWCHHSHPLPDRRLRPLDQWNTASLEYRTLLSGTPGAADVFHGSKIAVAVADLDGDGKDDFVFANQGMNRIAVQFSKQDSNGPKVILDHTDGILAPWAVQLADLNADGNKDLIVCNSGGNNILVYLGLGNGEFGPVVGGTRGIEVGTDPT